MRDWIVALIAFGSLPFILARPHVGLLMWAWISVMNPHRLAWSFAYEFPFAQMIAATTFLSLLPRPGRIHLRASGPLFWLLLLTTWMTVSTATALLPEAAGLKWREVMSMLLMTFVTIFVIVEKRHIEQLVWVLVLSVGFYGVKGGVFTLLGGGAHRVFGPPGTNLEDNNDLALALVMTLPLLVFLTRRAATPRRRWLLGSALVFCVFATLGCYSRGGLVALCAVGTVFWLKSRYKLAIGVALLAMLPLAVSVMPAKWFERMSTITSYSSDRSAMGRINAWMMTIQLARDRPWTGGGFAIYTPAIYRMYAPDPTNVIAPHSIYFSALGEHGFVGLALVVGLGVASWRCAGRIVRRSEGVAELRWAADLARMLQVSLIGYATGGAFLSLLYFDLPYFLLAVLVALHHHVAEVRAALPAEDGESAPGASPADPADVGWDSGYRAV